MNETRRAMLAATATAGVTVAINGVVAAHQDETSNDQKYVMAAGLTADEAVAWRKAAEAAAAFFKLPELHPMDSHEVSQAIHVLQNKLLSRPTYRKYLEIAKAEHEKAKKKKGDGDEQG